MAAKLAAELCVPKSTVDTIMRRLGEDGLLPRGSRGRAPAELGAGHLAHVLVGLMSIGDGIGGAATRAYTATLKIGENRCEGGIEVPRDATGKRFEHAVTLADRETFHEALTKLISQLADDKFASTCARVLSAVGVSFGEEKSAAWFELKKASEITRTGGARIIMVPGEPWRFWFGTFRLSDRRTGLTREVRFSVSTLSRLAASLHSGAQSAELVAKAE